MQSEIKTIRPLVNKWIQGTLKAPASKSYGQRALACAIVNPNRTEIRGLGHSDDEMAVLEIARMLGCEVLVHGDSVRILSRGVINLSETVISCGESGLATRMLIPVLANSERMITVQGHGSLLNRSLAVYDDLFHDLGVIFESTNGKLPVKVKGPLLPRTIRVDASKSSQYLSGLIIAYCASPLLTNATIVCENPVSVPYIHLTLDVLRQFGVHVRFERNELHFSGPYTFEPAQLQVEGDWSGASFLIAAAAISGSVKITGLNRYSKQADVQFLKAIEEYGAVYRWERNDLIVRSEKRIGFEFDATDCPDLFPPLAVLAAFATGETRIKGVHRLYDKESNRALTIQSEWAKFGVQVALNGDEMVIHGIDKVQASEPILAHGDHRIAMGAAILGLFAEVETTIEQANAVNKSFPEFYSYIEKLYRDGRN